jgi:hypothetical protein
MAAYYIYRHFKFFLARKLTGLSCTVGQTASCFQFFPFHKPVKCHEIIFFSASEACHNELHPEETSSSNKLIVYKIVLPLLVFFLIPSYHIFPDNEN